jgi:predicted nucleic acid-binding protein
VFSLDTSGFLDAWTRNYPPDTFQAFWDRMDESATAGTIKVSEEVVRELKKKDDGAAKWIEARTVMIVSTDIVVQEKVTEILKAHPRLVNAGKSRSGGDPFVIAVASIYGYSVITGELPTGNLTKPHIPDVCCALGVRLMNILEFVRFKGWKF